MHYAYVLESTRKPGTYYRGSCSDLRLRVADHNAGRCHTTNPLRPWILRFYAAFETIELARDFEHYLKSGSGHAFAKRRFGLR